MIQTGTEYKKPFGKELFGKEVTANYAYPRENLIAEPIFPYFVLDGGAYHLAYTLFGTTNGDELLEKTCSGELFKSFELDGPYHWERSFAYTKDTGFTKKYESQIWPQRLYMIIPLAHAFLRTGDAQYARKWLEIVKGWDEAHPYQPFDASIHYIKTDMVWRDMQVGWRTLSLLHSVFMLQDAPFTKDEWEYIYRFVELHANHLYEESIDRLKRSLAQNHVLQIGVALLMAGCLFPENENAKTWIQFGRDTVEMNMRGSIYPDGGSNEDSPSYSHFIVRLYVEAYLLLKNNNLPLYEGLYESIVRQYEWLYQCMAPSGKVLRLSDSYAMDGMADLRRAEALIPLDFPREKKSVVFPDSGMAILRRGKLMLVADGMKVNPGHQHLGRPQILLFYGEEPILLDPGCCSYDRWEFYRSLRSRAYHNIVYSPDLTEEAYTPVVTENSITQQCWLKEADLEKGRIVLGNHVEAGGLHYDWERVLTMTEDTLRIQDHAIANEILRWRSSLFFPRQDTDISRDGLTFRQLTETYLMTLTTDHPIEKELCPIMSDENKLDYAVVTRMDNQGTEFNAEMTIRFEPHTFY